MIVLAIVYSDDGSVVPYTVPGHPEDARIYAEFKKDARRREKAKKTLKCRVRAATETEIEQWGLQVPV